MMNPSKPSHRLNFEAVARWAESLSPEERAQCLDSLSKRGREQEAKALEQLAQALEQALEQKEKSRL